jgi:MSHA pilin protein MshC
MQNYVNDQRVSVAGNSCSIANYSTQRAYTMIEMVIVIVLLGILGIIAASRLLSGNTFNAIIIRDQIISLARTAQQNSLGRSGVNMTLTPNAGGDELTIVTSDSGGTIQTAVLSSTSALLSGDINDTDSCETTPGADSINNAAPMTIAFGRLGDLGTSGVTGSTGAISSALRVCINDSAAISVCVSPSGFAYAGDCDV